MNCLLTEGDGCILDLDYLLQLLELPEGITTDIIDSSFPSNQLDTSCQQSASSGSLLQATAPLHASSVAIEMLAALSNHMCLPLS